MIEILDVILGKSIIAGNSYYICNDFAHNIRRFAGQNLWDN